MNYISVKEAAERWNVSVRWVQKYCAEGRITDVLRFGHSWMIPKNAERPCDMRKKVKNKSEENIYAENFNCGG